MSSRAPLPLNGSSTTLEISFLSDTGLVRTVNEDRCAVVEPPPHAKHSQGVMLLVADGLGGHNAGEKASEMVVSLLPAIFYGDATNDLLEGLSNSIRKVNREVFQTAEESPRTRGMGSTLAAALVTADTLVIANVGDSRIYLLRGSTLHRLSTDHIIYRDLFSFMDGGKGREPRSILTQAIGPRPDVAPSVKAERLQPGDVLLLCSDGLTGLVEDPTVKSVLLTLPPADAAHALVALAKDAGGHDNITVVVARVLQVSSEAAAPVKVVVSHSQPTHSW